jgi:hypothetical protein
MGVNVVTNRHGYLRFRIFWKGRDIAVSTRYRDDGPGGKNRRIAEAKALLIQERLRQGAELHQALLDVLGDCPPRLMPAPPARSALTIGEYAETWLEDVRDRERKSYSRRATSYVRNVILPIVGKRMLLSDVTTRTVRELQDAVLRRTITRTDNATGEKIARPIKTKTARNIVTTYFRSLIVDAMGRHGIPVVDPFPT